MIERDFNSAKHKIYTNTFQGLHKEEHGPMCVTRLRRVGNGSSSQPPAALWLPGNASVFIPRLSPHVRVSAAR